MFNFLSVNTAEVNAGIRAPIAPVLSINASEDSNTLSWTSPYFTDFFSLYWSDNEFTDVDEEGVHEIITGLPTPTPDLLVEVSYVHTIPAAFSLSVIYYRVAARNRYYSTLSNQVDNYNFKLAIYEEIYKKTLDDLILRFTPEIKKQYEDSILWRSFVQSLASELSQGRFEIKEALKQLNIQKAVDVFLNMWYGITGISRINVLNSSTGETELETDEQYRQRLVDNVFWDKISNLALKKTMLLKLQIDGDVLDAGADANIFKDVPDRYTNRYIASHDNIFIPGETINFLFTGPDGSAVCVSDTGTSLSAGTLTFSGYSGPAGTPYGYSGSTSQMSSNSTAPPNYGGGTAAHDVITNPSDFGLSIIGDSLSFSPSGASGTFESDVDGYLTFKLTLGSVIPAIYDVVVNTRTGDRFVLTSSSTKLTAAGASPVNSKLLSNIYSVNLGVSTLPDNTLNDIYDEIFPLAAMGNVLTKILKDAEVSFNDWSVTLGNIPYGAIFMGAPAYSGSLVISTEVNWSIDDERYMDNQWDMNDGKIFYGNDGPDDIVVLTRTS